MRAWYTFIGSHPPTLHPGATPITHRILLPLLVLAALATPAAAQLSVRSTGQATVSVSSSAMRGVSGITAFAPGRYYVVDDIDITAGPPRFHDLAVTVDPGSGQITGSSLLDSIPFSAGSQYESIEFDPAAGTVFVSSEKDHTIRIFDTAGTQQGMVAVPAIYGSAAGNKSLESLAYHATTRMLWVANEEALTVDSGVNAVRLQRFVDGQPAGQFVYPLETPRNSGSGGFNGLSDLLALPDGRLLALERDYNPSAFNIAVRIFEIQWLGATDVSAFPTLVGASYTPAGKVNLMNPVDFPSGWFASISNLEGLALGEPLNDGSRSLLLGPADDADNGFLIPETMLALKLEGLATTGVREAAVEAVRLKAFPNPFAHSTVVNWSLDRTTSTRIVVTDAAGRRVRELAAGEFPRGDHRVSWDGSDDRGRPAPGGVYFVQVRTGTRISSARVVLIH